MADEEDEVSHLQIFAASYANEQMYANNNNNNGTRCVYKSKEKTTATDKYKGIDQAREEQKEGILREDTNTGPNLLSKLCIKSTYANNLKRVPRRFCMFSRISNVLIVFIPLIQ